MEEPAPPQSTCDDPLRLSADELDELVAVCRTGTWVGLLLMAMSATRLISAPDHGVFATGLLNRALSISEIVIFGACAALIWRLSRGAAMVLLAAHLATSALWAWAGSGWSTLANIVFALVLVRALRGLTRFSAIATAAAARRASPAD